MKAFPISMLLLLALNFLQRSASDPPFVQELKEKAAAHRAQAASEKVYLHLGRSLFYSGEDIWFKAYVRDGASHEPSGQSDILYIELLSPRGDVLQKRTLLLKDGSAPGDFALPQDAPGGLYTIRAYTNWMRNTGEAFERRLTVQAVVLPRLKMQLEFERKAFGPGEEVLAKLEVQTLANQALGGQACRLIAMLEGQSFHEQYFITDADGRASLRFALPAALASNDGLLTIQIPYQGRTESISRSIPILLNQIDLQFLPEGGDAIAGLKGRMAFKAVDEFGKPADVAGTVFARDGQQVAEFVSFHQGMGSFDFKPEPGESYTARLLSPAGNRQVFALPPALEQGFQLAIAKQEKDFIHLKISRKGGAATVYLSALAGGEIRFAQSLELGEDGSRLLRVPTTDWPIGIARFTLFDAEKAARCERLAFVNPQRRLRFDIETDQEQYLPGQQVQLRLRATDERGRPVRGDFSLAVVDDKLLSFADDKQGRLLAHFLLESELKGEIAEPNFYFQTDEPKALPALDYLMLTHGWRRFEWRDVLAGSLPVAVEHAAERARISGRVVGPDGQPAPGANIHIHAAALEFQADSQGFFETPAFDLPANSELVIETADGLEEFPIWGYSTGQVYTLRRKAVVREWGDCTRPRLSGLVRAAGSGQPIAGAKVQLVRHGQRLQQTLTDSRGQFRFARLEPGIYSLEAGAEGYMSTWANELWALEGRCAKAAISLPEGSMLTPIQVIEYRVPLIEQDNTLQGVSREGNALVLAPPPPWLEEQVVAEEAPEFVDQSIDAAAVIEPPRSAEPPPPPPPPPVAMAEEIFMIVEEMPRFPGCEDLAASREERRQCANQKLLEFIYQNIRYPSLAREKGIEGTVVVKFVVDHSGNVVEAEVVRDIGGGAGSEALRVVRLMREADMRWRPGHQRGRPVKVAYHLPVKFSLDGKPPLVLSSAQHRPALPRLSGRYYQARTFYRPGYAAPEATPARRHLPHWQPRLTTDANGEARDSFFLPHEASAYRISVEGFGPGGLPGEGNHLIYIQPLIQLDARLPALALTGDTLMLAIQLINHSDATRCDVLRAELPEGLSWLRPLPDTICLPAQAHRLLKWPIAVERQVENDQVRLAFGSGRLSSAWEQPITAISRGFPVQEMYSGTELRNRFRLNLHDPLPGSTEARLTVYLNPVEEILDGMERMLRQPTGCFEQVSSSNYPNLLVLNLLRQSGTIRPEVEQRALELLKSGYAKLLAYESPGGGFHWWGHEPGHEALTAYGLLQFMDMKRFAAVDEAMIERTAAWLLQRRDGQGSWQGGSQHLHSWQGGPGVRDAFIVWALAEAGMGAQIEPELQYAYQQAMEEEDPYMQALLANAMLRAGHLQAAVLLRKLRQSRRPDGAWQGASASIVCSRGRDLHVETTALAVLALLQAGDEPAALAPAIDFLAQSRRPNGFGNTQATVLALKALAAYAEMVTHSRFNGELSVWVNGQEAARRAYRRDQTGRIEIAGLADFLSAGEQEVEVRFENTPQPLPFGLDIQYAMRTPPSSAGCPLALETSLSGSHASVGETLRLSARIDNRAGEPLPTPLAQIGIPAGLQPQPWQLRQLMDERKVDFYEIKDGYVVFYFEILPPGTTILHLDLQAAVPGSYEAPASCAYLYYTNEERYWHGAGRVEIMMNDE